MQILLRGVMPKVRRKTSTRTVAQRTRYLRKGKKTVASTDDILLVDSTSTSIDQTQATNSTSSTSQLDCISSINKDGIAYNTPCNVGLDLVQEFKRLCEESVSEHQELHKKDAVQMKKYMRNKFEFFGLKAPQRRRLQKQLLDGNSEALKDRDTLFSVLGLLWEQEEREFQAFGTDFFQQYRKEFLGSSDDHFREAMSKAQVCITSKSWWDTVDAISYPVVGYFVKQRPALGVPIMQQWVNHDNMWLRRVSILHQLCLKDATDQTRLFAMCLSRSHEKEFFIRKAIGWALRDFSKTNKIAVREFVETNRESLSNLSVREALKYC